MENGCGNLPHPCLATGKAWKRICKKKEENFYIFIFQNLLFFKKLVSFSYPNPLACRVTVI